jgi:hypothetical protein
MRDNILNKETALKYDKKFSAIKQKALDECLKLVKNSLEGIKFPQDLIDKSYLLQSNRVTVVYSQEFKTEHISANRYSCSTEDYSIDEVFPVKPHRGNHSIEANKKLENLYVERKNLYTEKDKFFKELRNILYSFANDKQLIEVMPELKIYFQDDEALKKTTALVPIDQINLVRKQLAKR